MPGVKREPSLIRTEWGRQLLVLERGRAPGEWSEVAARVHAEAMPRLATLLGAAGVHAILRRSAKLGAHSFPWLAESGTIDTPASLRTALQGQPSELAFEAAATLFATFFAQLETFIGRRLTMQLLRGCWPELGDAERDAPR